MYNSSCHMSIKISPFMELNGYEEPNFVDINFANSKVPKTKDFL